MTPADRLSSIPRGDLAPVTEAAEIRLLVMGRECRSRTSASVSTIDRDRWGGTGDHLPRVAGGVEIGMPRLHVVWRQVRGGFDAARRVEHHHFRRRPNFRSPSASPNPPEFAYHTGHHRTLGIPSGGAAPADGATEALC